MAEQENAVEVRDLVRSYGKTDAVAGLSFSVRAGRCYGLFGRNGAGVPATSKAALQVRGVGLRSLFPGLPGAHEYLSMALPTFALLAFAFLNFRPEPWLSGKERRAGSPLGGSRRLILTIGFW